MRDHESLFLPGGLVLAVDDQPQNLELLETILAPEGFRVNLAQDGIEALESVEKEAPDCIVLDIMMPNMDGFEVCARLKRHRRTHFIPIVMLTALQEVEDKVKGLEVGADDFLNKPVSGDELLLRVKSLVKIKRLRDELDTSESIIYSLIQALESKDATSAGHSQRVAVHAVRLAQRLSLPDEQVELVAKSAILHDLGKIGLPDYLLWPSASLSGEAEAHFRKHPELGEQILAPFLSFAGVRAVVRHHHERLDGSGYPDGLRGRDFNTVTEIVAASNLYDELFNRLRSTREAARELREAAERGRFHKEMIEELLHAVDALPSWDIDFKEFWEDLLPIPEVVRKGKILIGHSTSAGSRMMRELLESLGHQVIGVGTGEEVLSAASEHKPDLVLVGVELPDMDGFSLCRKIKSSPETELLPVILVTEIEDREGRRQGAMAGADDLLSKPLNKLELEARIQSLLRLRLYFKNLEEHQSVILSLAAALEAKDPYTRGHSERVGMLASRLAREMGLTGKQCGILTIAGQLHDIGKIGISLSLLQKPDKLTREEFLTVMTHPEHGERICRSLKTVQEVLPIIRHHHERCDGSGYPDHLKGNEIPFGAKVLAVADAYDALTSERSYRKNMTSPEALAILQREAERGLWDRHVIAAMINLVEREMVG